MASQQSTASQAIATKPEQNLAEIMERVLIGGDLSKLSTAERLSYYKAVCDSIGLNPLTKPFDYITLSGRLTLYAKKDATDQLRELKGISVTALEREVAEGIYVVTTHVKNAAGRTDIATGAVQIDHLKGEAKANAMMKAETKSKRRATLSICGLGMLDETEVETIAAEPARQLAPERTNEEIASELIGHVSRVNGLHVVEYEVVEGAEVFTVRKGESGSVCTCGSEGAPLCRHRLAASYWANAPKPATVDPNIEPAEEPASDSEPQTITKAQLISLCELTKQMEDAGIEESTWRDQMENLTGSRSRKGLLQDELAKVIYAFNQAFTAQQRKSGKAKARQSEQ